MAPWSRAPAAPPESPNQFSEPTPSPSSQDDAFIPDKPVAARKLTRDEQADSELASLLKQLESEQFVSDAKEHRVATMGAAFKEEARETIYPTEMSCVTAFDELYYCYSLGGQFNNVYRYGSYRDCSEKGAAFRFCMKSKMFGEAARREMITKYYKEKAGKYKTGPSSEDVWEIRTSPLQE